MNTEQLSRVGEKPVRSCVPETLLKLQGSLVSMLCFAKI
ncbi:hypothetical protein HMPREF9970_0739 [Lachnoanaerobaculum saburreum F0468]|uniref:Uncharacterized protein n=1 Tax=Lachnoanaerobaculum saburreum F0468 TaxID=1095750 RepID=I0R3Z1_9FIRM|nr:hypothetical protein HMPREF9970_0739 [Lachnoanaerobaculum saburreum F0468]